MVNAPNPCLLPGCHLYRSARRFVYGLGHRAVNQFDGLRLQPFDHVAIEVQGDAYTAVPEAPTPIDPNSLFFQHNVAS